mmetsp:Transcript_11154/g.21567  ORF Transcript_11154/g.21567 Transcript_11154/m.21567 type:complete len:318 (-) Transcript_11154:652-1605(-)
MDRYLRQVHVFGDGRNGIQRQRLRPLDGEPKDSGPHELGHHSSRTRDTEKHCVEIGLLKIVLVEQNPRVGVDIGPGVLDLSGCLQNGRDSLEARVHELKQRVVGQLLQRKVSLGCVPGVRHSEHGVTEARHNTSTRQRCLRNRRHLLGCGLFAVEFLVGVEDPLEALLVGQPVQRTSQSRQTSGHRQVRIREGTADQMCGVRGHIPSLMVGMEEEVQSHQFHEIEVLDSQHVAEIRGPVKVGVVGGRDHRSLVEGSSVDRSSHHGNLGHHTEGILQAELPVLGFFHPFCVGFGEHRLGLKSCDGSDELSHRVGVRRE